MKDILSNNAHQKMLWSKLRKAERGNDTDVIVRAKMNWVAHCLHLMGF